MTLQAHDENDQNDADRRLHLMMTTKNERNRFASLPLALGLSCASLLGCDPVPGDVGETATSSGGEDGMSGGSDSLDGGGHEGPSDEGTQSCSDPLGRVQGTLEGESVDASLCDGGGGGGWGGEWWELDLESSSGLRVWLTGNTADESPGPGGGVLRLPADEPFGNRWLCARNAEVISLFDETGTEVTMQVAEPSGSCTGSGGATVRGVVGESVTISEGDFERTFESLGYFSTTGSFGLYFDRGFLQVEIDGSPWDVGTHPVRGLGATWLDDAGEFSLLCGEDIGVVETVVDPDNPDDVRITFEIDGLPSWSSCADGSRLDGQLTLTME